ncbi:putative endonuclease lcl3 [Serendipita sp. 411]|nr:putative endonuclease lcl3 [Serendipita sp. 411]
MFSSSSSPPPKGSWKESITSAQNNVRNLLDAVASPVKKLPYEAQLGLAMLGSSVLTVGGLRVYKRYVRRIPNSESVTAADLSKRRWIKGVVTSVGDADNFRLYHTPGIGWRWPLKFRWIPQTSKELKNQTLHIRMAGVDAPEAAHFGKPAQEYSQEALDWLKQRVEGKRVWCQLIHRDQYGRIVSIPMIKSFIPFRYRCVSLDMLRAGWADVYEQSNADYGKWGKDHFLSVLAEAQRAKRGMWAKGTSGETPSEYKKRHAAGAANKV